MLNLCIRASRACLRLPAAPVKCLRPYASFTLRDILYESNDEAGTLLVRFAKHIATVSQASGPDAPANSVRYSDYFPISQIFYLRKQLDITPADQLPAVIIFASSYRSNADPSKFAEILNELDDIATKRLRSMDTLTILRTLYAFMFLLPNWMTRLDFYRKSLSKLVKEFDGNGEGKDNFTQICFYMGLEKKNFKTDKAPKFLEEMLATHLDTYLDELTTMDLAIVANAAYKTSINVNSEAYRQRLEKEILAITTESQGYDALLVNFIKAARFERLQTEELCEHLSGLCKQPKFLRNLQSQGLVHIFAYFAECAWDDETVVVPLIEEFLLRLPRDSANIRLKDLSMFLWCCAHLNSPLTSKQLTDVEALLEDKLNHDEYRYFPDQLVDACLSLWTLGHKSQMLLEQTINAKKDSLQYNQRKQKKPAQPKVDSRLTVLMSAAEIEQPQWLRGKGEGDPLNLTTKVPEYLLRQRNDLVEFAKELANEEAVKSAKLVCPVIGINLPSVLVEFKAEEEGKAIVELLSQEQLLRFSGTPTGLVRLKIRLLEALGLNVAVLTPKDLTEKYSSLKSWLFEADPLDQPREEKAHQN